METVEKAVRFKKTEDINGLLQKVESYNALEFFEKYPLRTIREKCLEKLAREEYISTHHADWAEEVIIDLLKQDDYAFTYKVLEWYVFASKNDIKTEIRAIEFALNLEKKTGYISFDKISKLIAGKLMKSNLDVSYNEIPSLKEFLERSLNGIYIYNRAGYFGSDWYCAERALKIIVKMNIFNFLREIKRFLMWYKKGEIRPHEEFFPEYERAHHINIFKWAKRSLLKNKKEKQ